MIGTARSGASFGKLANYLLFGRMHDAGSDAERGVRVAWIETRNLPTNNPILAARFMEATTMDSLKVEKPVYHLSLAFHPDDVVTRDLLRGAADTLLNDLGLVGHEVLLVAHGDTKHPHVHLMVNRVHPETGIAWERWKDYAKIETSLRAQERAWGVTIVEGKHAARVGEPPAVARATAPTIADRPGARRSLHDVLAATSPARHAAERVDRDRTIGPARTPGEVRRAARTAEPDVIDRARAAVSAVRNSRSWEAVDRQLAMRGLRLERKGQGLVVTDGATAVKASRVARDLSMRALEARFGVAYDVRPMPIVPAVRPSVPAAPVLEGALRPRPAPAHVAPAPPIPALSGRVRFVATRLDQYAHVIEAMAAADALAAVSRRARTTIDELRIADSLSVSAEGKFAHAAASVWVDSAHARAQVAAMASEHRDMNVATTVRQTPAMFGAMHAEIAAGLASNARPAIAEATARRLAHVGQLAARAVETAANAPSADELRQAMQRVETTQNAAVRAQESVHALRQADALARAIARGLARGLARLDALEFAQLTAALPGGQAAIARVVRDGVVQAAAGWSAHTESERTPMSPAVRTWAADVASRSLQKLAPDEIAAVLHAVQHMAGLVTHPVATLRAGVTSWITRSLQAREMER